MLIDAHAFIWMGTNFGLSRFDIKGKAFKNYYQADGLQSNQFKLWHCDKTSNRAHLHLEV
jgi:ligand-binding sensor domain-containing protein